MKGEKNKEREGKERKGMIYFLTAHQFLMPYGIRIPCPFVEPLAVLQS